MDPLERDTGDKKPLFQLDRQAKLFLFTLVDAFLLFTVFVLGISWYQAHRQLDAINSQVEQLQKRFHAFEQEQTPHNPKATSTQSIKSDIKSR